MISNLVSYLDYTGEIDRPYVHRHLENFSIFLNGVKAIQNYPLYTENTESIAGYNDLVRDFGVCSPAMDNAIFSTVFVRGYGSFANVYPLPQTDDPWFFSSLWRGVSLRDRKWREEALIKKD